MHAQVTKHADNRALRAKSKENHYNEPKLKIIVQTEKNAKAITA